MEAKMSYDAEGKRWVLRYTSDYGPDWEAFGSTPEEAAAIFQNMVDEVNRRDAERQHAHPHLYRNL